MSAFLSRLRSLKSQLHNLIGSFPGSKVTLECNVLPGLVEAKRLWKFERQILIQGGNKDIKNRGALLVIDKAETEVKLKKNMW